MENQNQELKWARGIPMRGNMIRHESSETQGVEESSPKAESYDSKMHYLFRVLNDA